MVGLSTTLTSCDRVSIELLARQHLSESDAGIQGGVDAHTPPPDAGGDAGAPRDASVSPDSGIGGRDDAGGSGPVDAGPREPPVWLSQMALPVARGGVGAATAYNGLIHIVGGDTTYDGTTPATGHQAYDIDTGGYTSLAAAPDNHQWGPCFLTHGRHLYSFAGWKGDGKAMRRYDPATDMWTYLTPCPRKHVYGSACAVANGVIYIVAGSEDTTGDRDTNAVDAYDISTDSWTQRAPFPAKFRHISGAIIGTRLYVIGRGANLDVYDIVTNTWSLGPPIGRDARHGSAVSYDGSLYVFGGVGANNADRLGFPGPAWSALPALSSPRTHAGLAVVANEIHLFGGFGPDENAIATHEALIIP